jgi:hypothetical protein
MNWKRRLLEQVTERGVPYSQVEDLLEEWEMEYLEPPQTMDELLMGVLE